MNDEERKDIGADGAKTRIAGDEDVEGHRQTRVADDGEDVEGHRQTRATEGDEDVEGHGLLLDTDFYINRKMGREADIEREARERRQAKEARPNKPERG